jgi:predicted amidohydrolase YtcJ
MMTDSRRRLSMTSPLAASMLVLGVPTATHADDPPRAEVVIRHAKVITVDRDSRIAEAVAIRGDRIVAVGTDAEVGALAGPRTRTVNAGGKTLLPGLYDSHVHPLAAATSEKDHPIPSYRSLADITAYIAGRAHIQPKGSWIVVRYAFPTRLEESRFPTRAELDAVAPDHPVLHQAGPAGMVNSKALEVSGITRETPDPPAGQIVQDPRTGEPTGLLRNAYSVLKGLPSDAYADRGADDAGRLKTLLRLYNRRGLTSIADRAASDTVLMIYRALRDRGELTVRVNATRVLANPPGDRAAIVAALNALAGYDTEGEPNGPTGVGDHWVRIGPLKLFLDGGMLNGTAYMRAPWGVGPAYQITEPAYRGLLFVPSRTLALIATESARRGWQMTAHTAGEAAMDELLTAYEAADRAVGIRGRRWLITHANFTSAENLGRCAALGVGADLQPAWIWEDTRTLLQVLGPDRMAWFHPYRKWLDAGLVIGGGSDHMIRLDALEATNPWDPWLGIWVAVTRRTEGAGVLNPDQRLTRAEAIRFYTINNALLHCEEHQKGSIEPGKLADLILVDRDPLTCPEDDLRTTQVLWTMVGGKMVYRSDSPAESDRSGGGEAGGRRP